MNLSKALWEHWKEHAILQGIEIIQAKSAISNSILEMQMKLH